MVRGKTTTLCRSRDEHGGVKAQRRTASMPSLVLGSAPAFFPRHSLQQLSLQAAPRHRVIAFALEGSPLDRCQECIIRAKNCKRRFNSMVLHATSSVRTGKGNAVHVRRSNQNGAVRSTVGRYD